MDAQEIVRCSGCRLEHRVDHFETDRLGRRRKTCLSCKEKRKNAKCEHSRRRAQCKECGGGSICEHGRQRSKCKDCGGSNICDHGRQRDKCKECGGSQICEHGRHRQICRGCNPEGHLRDVVSARVRSALKPYKSRGGFKHLGCSAEELKTHIEGLWVEGMTWENYGRGPGSWQIDHVIPVNFAGADGGAPTLEEVVLRLHWLNCQPLWTTDNIAKGNRYIGKPGEPAP